MGATSKIAVGVAGGYLLGRTRKLKLALTLAGVLAGKRIAGVQDGLRSQGSELVEKNPDLARLQQDSGKLLGAAKAAALTTATQRLHTLSDTLRGSQPGGGTEDREEPDTDEADTEQTDTEQADTDQADTDEDGEDTGSDQPDTGEEDAATSETTQERTRKTASKGTKKTAKKAAKKSTGTNRRSSGR